MPVTCKINQIAFGFITPIIQCYIHISQLSSLILILWFDSSCSEQTTEHTNPEEVQTVPTPVKLIRIGLLVQFLMVAICGLGIIVRPAKPVLSFGTAVSTYLYFFYTSHTLKIDFKFRLIQTSRLISRTFHSPIQKRKAGGSYTVHGMNILKECKS